MRILPWSKMRYATEAPLLKMTSSLGSPRVMASSGIGLTRPSKAQRRFVAIVVLIYLLAIVEGVLRKWLLPSYSQYLFFIRDPFVILAYFVAWQGHLIPRRGVWFRALVALAVFGALIAMVQALATGFANQQLILLAYGWRNYFLYGPLAILIGTQFGREDLQRVFRWSLLLAIPIAVLMVMQFRADPRAPINVGISEDKNLQFRGLGLDSEHTRPMGPFTSTTGETEFSASSFAILLALIVLPPRRRSVPPILLLFGGCAILTTVAVGGSRGALVHCGISLAFSMLLGLAPWARPSRWRATLLPALVVASAALSYPIIFPEGFQAFVHRWEVADQFESERVSGGIFGRALLGFVDFAGLLDAVPLLGRGLGSSGNAGIADANASQAFGSELVVAENDWGRQIVELGPILGVGYITLRVALTLWLARTVWRGRRRADNPIAMLLFSFVAPEILIGQITGHGSVHVFGWLFLGFTLAACRASPAPVSKGRAERLRAGVQRASAAPISITVPPP